MRHLVRALGVLGVAVLSGCVTNPITGRSQLALVPEQVVADQGNAAYNQQIQAYESQGRILTDPWT